MALRVNVSTVCSGHHVKTFAPGTCADGEESCSEFNRKCSDQTAVSLVASSLSPPCNSHWSDDEVPRKKMKVTEKQGLRQQVISDTENEKAFSFSRVKQPPINGESEKMSPKMTYGSKVNPSSSLVASLKWDESVFSNLDESYRLWQEEKCNISPSFSSRCSLAASPGEASTSSSTASLVPAEEASIETTKCIQLALHDETKQLTKEQQMLDEQINLLKKLIVYTFSPKVNKGATNLPLRVK